ncbi:DUF6939 family protein [Flavobacterium collinsii]|uniref:Uncharacterized protein n=1 Tax=Flavobacterium collinsii TaxID=1114861 RepID=A0A9W4XAD5_9FLAO|nr:hypothetical protein [Flavobacterium collinsii]CAI2767603.1 conserved protein of unknown function [Flavobacterium collinsii]
MPIFICHKRKSVQTIQKEYPNSEIIDVTSKATNDFVKFSPFYPVGNIPIPFIDNCYSESVEGIWQGLKVFENYGIDESKFLIKNMKNLKRTTRKFGIVLGHQKGINSSELLDYYNARLNIYVPSYEYVLKKYLNDFVEELKIISSTKSLVLLD